MPTATPPPRAPRPDTGLPLALLGALLAALLTGAPAHAQDAWSDLAPGVRLLRRTTARPWRIFAVTADLCTPGLSLRATAEADRWRTVPSFGDRVGARVAINADFFSYESQRPTGLALSAGRLWNPDMGGSGEILFGDDRAHLVLPGRVADLPEWAREGVAGRPTLVEGGAVPAEFNRADCAVRHPRTALGLSADRRQLILAVVDGRSANSVGMTCTELGGLMRELGAHTAMNLDGGGSSTLWTRNDGTVNRPSDGNPRTVANHLAILTGDGPAGSCDFSFAEVIEQAAVLDAPGHTDVNGDGRADVCARDAEGFVCHLANGPGEPAGFDGGDRPGGGVWRIPGTGDADGWGGVDHYSTLRLADLDGDGRADLCARANAGLRCWRSNGAGFDRALVGPAFSDANGWDAEPYGSTLRFADLDGDGRDDVCARAAAGLVCHLATGDGFGPALDGPDLSDASGWNTPDHYGTLRLGDLDGDGRADVCARGGNELRCWRFLGDRFSAAIVGPAWSDAAGFTDVSQWSTIRLIDLDGDGAAEVCGRTAERYECARYAPPADGGAGNGTLGAPFAGPTFSNASGWADRDNYGTLRFGDLDGDGDQDLCARADRGMVCWINEGDRFPRTVDGPGWSDDTGWNDRRYNTTITLADVDGDGRADLCGRAARGYLCHLSQGDGFGPALEAAPFSNANGFADVKYRSTIRAATPPPRPAEPGPEPEPDAGSPTDAGPPTDAEPTQDADITSDADASTDPDAGNSGGSGGNGNGGAAGGEGGAGGVPGQGGAGGTPGQGGEGGAPGPGGAGGAPGPDGEGGTVRPEDPDAELGGPGPGGGAPAADARPERAQGADLAGGCSQSPDAPGAPKLPLALLLLARLGRRRCRT